MTKLHDGVAAVTGGASGIGLAIAERLVAEGARVAIGDIDASAVVAAADAIGALPFVVDVTDGSSTKAFAAGVVAAFGQVDMLVSNAGVASVAPLAEMTDADWDWLLGVNLYGTAHAVTAFIPHLTRPGGHILVTGSMAGLSPDAGMGGYGVTKFAVTAYAEVLAQELASDGIEVTLLAPGPVRTRLGSSSRNRPNGPEGALHDVDLSAGDGGGLRWIDPEEVAEIALRAIEGNRRYAITHPDWAEVVERRHRAIEDSFRKSE
ncbi:MAG TPA: SDR family oxidoreductase [Microbacteriaceae bacterium]|nr:SDR family oxidoreductase [Microbacteriaceae bacterium]